MARYIDDEPDTQKGDNVPGHLLSPREWQITHLICNGLTDTISIANALGISFSTVKTHIANILAKLGLRDKTQIAIWYHKTVYYEDD